ncbi:acyl-CoA/acyl-ACP dehydrogenase [Actinomycetospora sp. TBRC 11914]|nr:acyl-CoA/acyl-ACP dehydrogenase [Actinomycetospora sp. TBRC 11914]
MGDLRYSEVEEDLRAAVRALLDRRAGWQDVLARTETAEPVDRALWRTLAAELGCAALPVAEELGGAGASWREAAVVAEELGRAVAPVPFLGCSVATALLLAVGERDLLAGLAGGDRIVALAVPAASAPGEPLVPLAVDADRISGDVPGVLDAAAADVLLVPAGGALYALDVTDPGVRVTPAVSLDMTRPIADVTLDAATGRRLATGAVVADAVAAAQRIGAVLLAAEQLGVARRCLDEAVAYLRDRHQFGRPLGSFQALKHRAADLAVLITQACAVARYAADCAATGASDLPVAAALAQAHLSPTALRAAQECLQLHGGIGFTWEYVVHLFLKRATSQAIVLGTADRHRAALGELLGVPGPEETS